MFDDFQDMDDEQADEAFAAYTPPEPDGLEPPRASNFFIDHQDVEKTLLDLINSNAIPHALIFSGPMGIGKSTLAFRLARHLFKIGTVDSAQDSLFGDAAPAESTSLDINKDDPIFSKVASGGHPDLLTLERPMDAKKGIRKNNLDVTTARKVAPFLRMTSADGGWRVVIIDDADTMNRNAQNALLKILEEPPANAILILITHRLGAMIPTIRSRCRVLNFEPLKAENLKTLMEKEVGNTLGATEQQILSSMANGSIGAAQKIIETGGIETAQTILELFERWPNFNWVDIHHLAENAGRAGKDNIFKNIEATFLWIADSIVFAKARNQQTLEAPLNQDIFTKIIAETSLQQWLNISEKLTAHFAQARFANLDKKQAVLAAFNIITAL